MKKTIIEIKNLVKTFGDGAKQLTVLKSIDLNIYEGEIAFIIGRSGAGKSTLMYQLSLLDTPNEGEIIIDNYNVLKLSEEEKTQFRLEELGYVFQDYAILPELTAQENVMLPLLMLDYSLEKAKERAAEVLDKVGLGEKLGNLPSKLSGGEQQRVSIARAISNKPKILFADEPTANLDIETSDQIMDLFVELNKAGQTIVMVTHDEIKVPGRILKMHAGTLALESKK